TSGRCQCCMNMTSCLASEWLNDGRGDRPAGSSGEATMQIASHAGDGGTVCAAGRGGGARQTDPPGISGDAAGSGAGGAGTQHHSAENSGGAFAADEDIGRVRFWAITENLSRTDTGVGPGKLY